MENTRIRERKRSFITPYFILEVLLIAIHPLPFLDITFSVKSINLNNKQEYVDVQYRLSDFLLTFMFLRIALLIRTIFNYTMFTDLYAKRLCESYGFTANIRFTFKCFIIRNPGWTVLWTLASTVFILAYILRIYEI
jgi:hypothetical protein